MFLKMSPEERLQANDNALRAILELRNAFRQKQGLVFDKFNVSDFKKWNLNFKLSPN